MNQLIPVSTLDDIAQEYQNTPVGLLFEYNNLNRPLDKYTQARLLIGMCMDNRKRLRIPDNFAYMIRSGGGNLSNSEFTISYAIAIGGVSSIALIGHNNCGMVNLNPIKEEFLRRLVGKTGWERSKAEEHFMHFAPIFEIGNEIDFVLSEANRLRLYYPGIQVTPLFYRVEDNLLYIIAGNDPEIIAHKENN